MVLINNVASRYLSPARIITEFVDNSIDDMEPHYNAEENTYSRPVNIEVHVNSKKSYVRIVDNANGMSADTLARLVSNIGDSSKRGDEKKLSTVNGRFGFGVQSFRAAAHKISFVSRCRDSSSSNISSKQFQLSFTRDQADNINPPREMSIDSMGKFAAGSDSGTEVTIEQWKNDWLTGNGGAEKLHEQLQRHFERLLHRQNIRLCVIDDVKDITYTCLPVDYAAAYGGGSGNVVETDNIIEQRIYVGSKQQKQKEFIDVLFMILPKDTGETRPVNIFCNGRRVSSVRYLKSFMSKSKNAWIWNHPKLVGHIEASCLTPVITRDEFKKNAMRNKVYQELYSMEAELSTRLENHGHNYIHSDETFQKLESVINSALSLVVREEKLSKISHDLNYGDDSTDRNDITFGMAELPGKSEENDIDNVEIPSVAPSSNDNTEDVSPLTSSSPRRQPDTSIARGVGLGVKFVKNLENNRRAKLVGSYIEIDVTHPDFETRVASKNGHPKLTERLLGYIANVVSAAYRSSVHTVPTGGTESDLHAGILDQTIQEGASSDVVYDEMLDTIVESSTRLEEKLQKRLPALQKEIDQMISSSTTDAEEP